MKFAVVVYSSSTGSRSAQAFCRAALLRGHEIYRVFFFGEGVLMASPNNADPGWSQLTAENSLDLVACVTAAVKRGLLVADNQANTDGLKPGFTVAGLTQLTDAALQCDRVVTFR